MHQPFLAPEGPEQTSSGRRPGNTSPHQALALKGRNRALFPRRTRFFTVHGDIAVGLPMYRPVRARVSLKFLFVPRALPWAGMFRPLRAS